MEAARYVIPRSAGSSLLVVGISASGETARTIEAIELAQEVGARTLAITTNLKSTLGTTADSSFAIDMPKLPHGPGLISYLGALLAGFALGAEITQGRVKEKVDDAIRKLPNALARWIDGESEKGREAAKQVDPAQSILFLGSGPARGAAMFAAAKAVEAVGQSAASQDVEEWAHMEYFNEPASLPIWLLTAGGRSSGREKEIAEAVHQIGRNLIVSTWEHGSDSLREDLSPLALWVGPVAYANSLMDRIGEEPFRGFGGGRHPEEGGGANRIQSSEQIRSLKEFERFNPLN